MGTFYQIENSVTSKCKARIHYKFSDAVFKIYFDVLTFTSKLCALSDTFCSLLLALTHARAGRNGISCPRMIQVKSVLWSYPLVQSVKVSVIKHHQLSYFPAFCCLSILPLVLEGGTGIRKYKIRSTLQMESENVLDFVYVYQHFQSGELC